MRKINKRKNKWNPIHTAPKNVYIQLLVDSGYHSTPYDIVIAKMEPQYRNWWIDTGNDAITDRWTGEIYGWLPWNPDEQILPDESENYYILKDDDVLEHGDEMQISPVEWVKIDQADINSYKKITGKDLCWEEGDRTVRRKIQNIEITS